MNSCVCMRPLMFLCRSKLAASSTTPGKSTNFTLLELAADDPSLDVESSTNKQRSLQAMELVDTSERMVRPPVKSLGTPTPQTCTRSSPDGGGSTRTRIRSSGRPPRGATLSSRSQGCRLMSSKHPSTLFISCLPRLRSSKLPGGTPVHNPLMYLP